MSGAHPEPHRPGAESVGCEHEPHQFRGQPRAADAEAVPGRDPHDHLPAQRHGRAPGGADHVPELTRRKLGVQCDWPWAPAHPNGRGLVFPSGKCIIQSPGGGGGGGAGTCFNFHSDGGGTPPPWTPSPPPPSAQVQLKTWVLGTFFRDGEKISRRLRRTPHTVYLSFYVYSAFLVLQTTMTQRSLSVYFCSPVQPSPRAKHKDIIDALLYFRFKGRITGRKRQEAYNEAQKACATLFLSVPMATLV